jgi:DivIVA domain-containing protein
MMILNEIAGWVFIVSAAMMAPSVGRALMSARRSGGVLPDSLWLSLGFLCVGVDFLCFSQGSRWDWFAIPIGVAGVICLLIPGVMTRGRAGIGWWRFWTDSAGHVESADTATSADLRETESMDLIQRIDKAIFRTTRLRAGYDERQVDAFLAHVIAVLREGGQPDREELRNPAFARTWLRPGYEMADVDGLLREIELSG